MPDGIYGVAGSLVRAGAPVVTRLRRAALVRRIQVLAAAAGAEVDADIALDAVVEGDVRVVVAGGTTSRLVLGPGARVGRGVRLHLDGADIEVGGWTDLRPGVVLNVSGRLRIGSSTVLGAGTTVHCAHDVAIGDRVGIGEYSTVVDTSHHHSAPDQPVVAGTRAGSVHVGDAVFVGTKATLTRNCSVGDYAFVGAGSVVVGEVPARRFFSGVPARDVGPVSVPWE
jgi:acetyltransferase-like isoleucine patch superfamily enzyme